MLVWGELLSEVEELFSYHAQVEGKGEEPRDCQVVMNVVVLVHVKNSKQGHSDARNVSEDEKKVVVVVIDLAIEHLVVCSDVLLVDTPVKNGNEEQEDSVVHVG